jgi:hypothetical protein
MLRALTLLMLCLMIGCKRDRPFTTLAVYDAPKSDLRLMVWATGIGPGRSGGYKPMATIPTTAIFCPLSNIAHAVRIDVPPWAPARKAVVTDGATSTSVAWDLGARVESLTGVLRAAGYLPERAELLEVLAAIDGVAWGQNATLLADQTELVVVNVDFSAHGPIDVASCAAISTHSK